MDLTLPRELTVDAEDWLTASGRPTGEDLVIRPVGPLLPGDRPGWATVTGWRDIAGETEAAWTVVMVRRSVLRDGADGSA